MTKALPAIVQLPRQRELPRQPGETQAQIFARRGTLVCLRLFDVDDGRVRALGAMAYMADH
jgi:hypothetical protein